MLNASILYGLLFNKNQDYYWVKMPLSLCPDVFNDFLKPETMPCHKVTFINTKAFMEHSGKPRYLLFELLTKIKTIYVESAIVY